MNLSYHSESSKSNVKIAEEFTLRNATLYGGYNLISDFLTSMGLQRMIGNNLSITKAHWAEYPLAEVVQWFLEGYLCGLQRPSHFESLEDDPLWTAKSGRQKLPDHTSFNKDLKRFTTEESVRDLRGLLVSVADRDLSKRDGLVLDFDSSVETVYGHQEGAAIGYNPHKHGRASYHPLLVFDGVSAQALNAQLRPGDTNSATDAVAFIHETLAMYPGRNRKARLDRGFDSNEIMETLEAGGVGYVIKLKDRQVLAAAIMEIPRKHWKVLRRDEGERIEIARFWYQANSWSCRRRAVVVRKQTDEGPQKSFWDEWGYSYSSFVTNLDWKPLDVYHFYNHRGTAELYIKEEKLGFGIDRIPTGEFFPNAANLVLKLIAYNLGLLPIEWVNFDFSESF